MIIDTLRNAERYFHIHPLFASAFEFIRSKNLSEMETGKFNIQNDELKAIVSAKDGVSIEESLAKFECHNSHIDIQFCIRGKEKIGWKPREKCTAPKGDFNQEKDVQFYNDQPDTYFELADGQFAILFPEDVHAPMIGEGEIKKLVIKVKI